MLTVFYYRGKVDWLEKKVITSKSGRFINHEKVLLDINYDMSVSDYYFVSDKNFDKLIENNCSNYINVIDCTIEPYHVEGKQEICENNILYYRKVKEDFSITFHDLLYPKLDLEKLFNQTEPSNDNEVIEQLRKQVTALTAENDKLNEKLSKQADTPADDDKELNPKTHTAVSHLLNVLFHKAQLDITAHQGTTNKNIVNLSKSLNARITEKPVSYWIKQVQQLRIDTQKE